MLSLKYEEIQRLETHVINREDGLNCSEKMLAQDTSSFIQFFNNIKEQTNLASKELEDLRKKKGQKQSEWRQVNDEHSGLVSSINKNLELLSVYNQFKVFLD